MVTIKEYRKVESLQEAWELNQKKTNCIIGGMLWTKMKSISIQTAIDLSGLGLDTIEEDAENFRIGAMVTLRQLEQHEGLNSYTQGAIKDSVKHIVGVQFRNLATVGGSIFGRFGFSDVLTMFQVMDTSVELVHGGIVPLEEFALRKFDRDVLVRLIVKKQPKKYVYQSVRNSKTDFPVLTCAAAKNEAGTYCFSIGARPGRAVVLRDETGILTGGKLSEEQIKAFSEYAEEYIKTEGNMRGSGEYRSHLVSVLVGRSLSILEKQAEVL